MSKGITWDDFMEFLKGNGVDIDDYYDNCNKYTADIDIKNNIPDHWLYNAFHWVKTPQGFHYWEDIDKKWDNYLKYLRQKTKKFNIPKSDLSKCKVGDWLWTIENGWATISKIYKRIDIHYPIICVISNNNSHKVVKMCTFDGYINIDNINPTVWAYNPFDLDDKPPEPKFEPKKGDRVLVCCGVNGRWHKRYFAYIGDNSNRYYCYMGGGDEWSSEGKTFSWKYCKPAD